MAVQLTYPGVYIQEVPSGVRTITGVSTSITAFIGRTVKGKPNEPLLLSSYADFERMYGGLSIDSTVSYAVRDFFLNGGSQAIIVRIHNGASPAKINVTVTGGSPPGPIVLNAASPGLWGNDLSVTVKHVPVEVLSPPASPPSPTKFNLIVNLKGQQVEQHLNLSMDPNDPRYMPYVLKNRSNYLEAETAGITDDMPDVGTYAVGTPGSDGLEPGTNDYLGNESNQTGLYAFYKTDIFNMLCIPPPAHGKNTHPLVYQTALKICLDQRAMLLVDAPFEWGDETASPIAVQNAVNGLGDFGIAGDGARNAMLYFPLVKQSDSLRDGQLHHFVPCGTVAGVIAKTDATRGVWKTAAGADAALNGTQGLQINLTDPENGTLNILGINCLRTFPVTGRVVWGGRTMRGADQSADEYKYAAVRRTALYIEESLYRGTQWVVFEPNDEPLWAQIRLNVGAFMHNLFRQGAFQGKTPREAYLVKCDRETTTQTDINMGVVNILVGFAPLKPAEFVVIKIQQLAGQIDI